MHGRLQGTEAAALYSHVLSRVSPKVLQKTNNQETRSCVHCVKEGLEFLGEGLLICGSEHLESAFRDPSMMTRCDRCGHTSNVFVELPHRLSRKPPGWWKTSPGWWKSGKFRHGGENFAWVVENFARLVENWKTSPGWWKTSRQRRWR